MRRVDKPEWSSFTSDDIVFVIESAATRRSFRRFLGTPEEQSRAQVKQVLLSSEQLVQKGLYYQHVSKDRFLLGVGLVSPCAKASSTSPPTPARQSCGVWVGVEPAEVERMGMGMEQPAPWLGEECGEPPDWECKT